jgi:hypothetical protein
MAAQGNTSGRDELRDERGVLQGYRSTFGTVTLEAIQDSEIHRTLNPDHTVTEQELPGTVNLYVVIDGGRILLDRLRASDVLEAIDAGQRAQQAQSAQEQAQSAQEPQDEPSDAQQTV